MNKKVNISFIANITQFRVFCFIGCMIITMLLFIGCKKKEQRSALDEETAAMFPAPKPENPKLKIANIQDVAKMIIARSTEVKGENGNNTEYEIVTRDTDGRNEKVLAKRFFNRFFDDDLVWIEELNAILYMGQPNVDSERGFWLYDYKNNIDKMLNEKEAGLHAVTIAKDRKHVFYSTDSHWHSYNLITGEKKFIYAFEASSYRNETINPEGTLIGGTTEKGFFVEDIRTQKRYEWIIQDSISHVKILCFSKNLKYVYFEKSNNETDSLEAFFSPVILGKKLDPNKLINWKKEYCSESNHLSSDGKYFYSNCGANSYRLNISQDKIEEIAFIGWQNPFRIIEDLY